MAANYETYSVQTDLKRKTATVTLKAVGIIDFILVGPFAFDPPGEQTEDELEALALAAAKERLLSAAAALG